MPGDLDAGDFVLVVNGKQVREFTGLRDWTLVKEVSYNEGPGGRAFGFNHQRSANKVTFSISVRETSQDLRMLHDLVSSEDEVAIVAAVPLDKRDKYANGQEIGLGCERGILSGGSRGKGSGDAEDVTFEVSGIGPVREYVGDTTSRTSTNGTSN